MNRSNWRIKPIGASEAIQLVCAILSGWFLLWAFTGIFSELFHYLTNLH